MAEIVPGQRTHRRLGSSTAGSPAMTAQSSFVLLLLSQLVGGAAGRECRAFRELVLRPPFLRAAAHFLRVRRRWLSAAASWPRESPAASRSSANRYRSWRSSPAHS